MISLVRKSISCILALSFGLTLTGTNRANAESPRAEPPRLLAQAAAATAESESVKPLSLKKPLVPITRDFTLDNGLRVIVSEDHTVPVASLVLIYDVGARDEKKGKSGFAHLFEHMMFEGSANVPKGAFFKYVQASGGQLNASTHADFTDYFEKLPSNQIELAFWLESDRMRSLKVTQENFKNQLDTVKEEKRLRIDNQPYMPAALQAESLIFDNWSNAHPVIGSVEDLEASTVGDVQKFFDTYYAPNNAVIAVVGDVKADEIEALAKKYFASIPKQPAPQRPNLAEPAQTKPKYLKVEDKQAKVPAFWMAWKAPQRRDRESFALNLFQTIMTTGTSSRLYQRLVKDDQVALQVQSSYEERRGPSEYDFFVVYKPNSSAEAVRKTILEEVKKVQDNGVTAQELEKAKNKILQTFFSSSSYSSLQRSLGRGEMLAQYASFYGDPTLIDKDVETYLSLTAEDIQNIAKKVFTTDGITVVDVVPAPADAKPKAEAQSNKESRS
ncbi:MAG: insulinase family protein [Candidatus Obscuribacterales bacterium]|nr:insulinase family protein [Candidatus Obscuribacterales bacterium]